MKTIFRLWFSILSVLAFSGCSVNYSFTGISTDAESVSIQFFENYAALAPPTLSQEFTESMKDIFLQQTNLKILRDNGELQFEGEITKYSTEPVAITGDEQTALNRLSITVNVRFTNTLDDKQSFERSFTRFEDYDSSQSLSAVESDLVTSIIAQLTQDILNAAIGDW